MAAPALLFALLCSSPAAAQSLDAALPAQLDDLAASYWQPSIKVAFGTFTFADTSLPSPFSRWLEESLAASIARCSRIQLFNKGAAAAMDPAFRAIYGDFFKSNTVDALLSGRYFDEGGSVRARLELTGLAAGAVYREGEDLVVLVTVNEDAWVKVYHIDVDGAVQLIWPNRFGGGGKIGAGEAVRIPGSGAPFAFRMTPPFGTEFIKVVASTRPFASNEADFVALEGDARGVIARGLAVASADAAERAEAMASYVIMEAKP